MRFAADKIYYIHLPPATFGSLSPEEINKILSDGRYSSPFMEAEVPKGFVNLVKKPEYIFGDFNYVDEDYKSIEMRGFSSLGKQPKASLIPNYMIGKGRRYDEPRYIEALDSISGWMITYNLKSYQDILIFHYPAEEALASNPIKKSLTKRDIRDILGASPDAIHEYLKDPEKITVVDNEVYEFDKPWNLN